MTAGLYSLNGQWIAQWQLVSAGAIVAALPPVAMFFLMQRHFIAGLTLGRCEMIRTWRLDGPRQTLALGSRNDRLPRVIYWGPRLPDDEDMDVIYDAHKIDVTGGMLDANPELTICPESSRTFPGQPGLVLADGERQPLYSASATRAR